MTAKIREMNPGTVLRAAIRGAFTSLMLMLVLTGILALLVCRELISEGSIPYGVLGILLVSSFFGGIAAKKTGDCKLLFCGISAAAFFLILLGILLLFFDGGPVGMLQKGLLVLAGNGAAALAGNQRARGRGVHRRGASSKVVQKIRVGKY